MELTGSSYLHGTLEAIIHKAYAPISCLSFVAVDIDGTTVASVSCREANPRVRILCAHPPGAVVTLALRTRWLVIAKVRIPASSLQRGKGEWRVFRTGGKWSLEFSLRFLQASAEEKVQSSFPERRNCGVVLYQDADHGGEFRPPATVGEGKVGYKPRRLWEDVYRAIDGAERLVCIAGWSLNPKLVLVRDPQTEIREAFGVELGDLLKRKADEGVVVRILIWDDETSLHSFKNPGLMGTHDEDAFAFFRHTKVTCRLSPRLHRHLPTPFTHHQKTITVDASPRLLSSLGLPNSHRQLLSFLGGLDLCGGRYDTDAHSLFRTLNAPSHAHDFYQPSIPSARLPRGGPRQPWHDTHACVVGAAARDVLANFDQRWAKLSGAETPSSCPASEDHAVGDWIVQIFRSIDGESTDGLPRKAEHSIYDAHVSAIRKAQRFIYIENQYFMGGCHLWEADRRSGCRNLIPVEIALKVAGKIRAGERFAAYIVVPMWPEGSPNGEEVQEMLHWTRMTMAAMYRIIGQAIQENALSAHPRDYLNFFCLANREKKREGEYTPPASPPHGSHYWNAQKNRRFMIYVHSKLMIVDDEYLLIGSANMNQRSMDGERDTEIALGCRQAGRNGSRREDIFTYRTSLWYEHTRRFEANFAEPESFECVKTLREIGEDMWKKYSGEEAADMEGVHLVNYPVSVSSEGLVKDLQEGGGTFPDTTARVRGRRSMVLPPICTT